MSSKLIGGDSDFFASLVSWWLNKMLLHTILALHAAYIYLLVFCKILGCSPTVTIGAVPISLRNISMSPCVSWFHLKIYMISILSHEGIHCILLIALTTMYACLLFYMSFFFPSSQVILNLNLSLLMCRLWMLYNQ